MSLLTVQNLCAGYGRIRILDSISLTVEDGEYVGVLGHNGMGKTTLLKTLMGLVPVSDGRITLDGTDITRAAPERRARERVGYVPQGREIYPGLTVQENLRMGAILHKLDAAAERQAIRAVLADFPLLEPLLDRPGGALSGGEQQLLALARCLIGDPRLILLDEPTEGIQPSIIAEIIDRLRQLKIRARPSVILVEQNLDFIKALADRVLIIQRGQITHSLQPEELTDPDVVGGFIGMHA